MINSKYDKNNNKNDQIYKSLTRDLIFFSYRDPEIGHTDCIVITVLFYFPSSITGHRALPVLADAEVNTAAEC